MKSRLLRLLAAVGLLLLSVPANAAVECSVSSNGFNTAYDPALAAPTKVQTSVMVSCTRSDPATDPVTVNYAIKANNGLYANGVNNRAQSGTSYAKYDVYTDINCASQWKGNVTFSGTVNFAVSSTATHTFWGCIAAGQNSLPAGTYWDQVTMTMDYGPNPQSTAVGMFPVYIVTQGQCSFSSPPGTLGFSYTSFQPTAANVSAFFGVTCTNGLPYTISLDSTSGTIAGLSYSLALSGAAGTGSGVQQSLSVDGSMPAGQPGTCAMGTCAGTNPHTLTIAY
ncbi:MAG: spore coat protein U domain-containing protein [Ramlibacter sp.]